MPYHWFKAFAALASVVAIEFGLPDGTVLNRDLGIEWKGPKCRTRRELAPTEMFFGCGEKSGQFNKRGEQFSNWNTDNPFHAAHTTKNLVKTIPCYDLYITWSESVAQKLKAAGAQGILVVPIEKMII